MPLKHLIDLLQVKCHGFDKIIHAKKGWKPTTSRMVTIVSCPSSRTKIDKALVRRFDDREEAGRRGAREKELWSEKQHQNWKEINDEWQHISLIPYRHIQEETMEVCMQMIELVQFSSICTEKHR
ncbi:hypothetical protein OXYTRIMIC_400 [Oxytricha trifallax]|uniref:Uncharacterized protein n=1 Tax=Oxytricha trifallax TaxID=1172189 RepID=A0A073IAG5_9SPIT|nr:hypothetical protein OXYTRIMIC_400 [Oxytricha trifallax]